MVCLFVKVVSCFLNVVFVVILVIFVEFCVIVLLISIIEISVSIVGWESVLKLVWGVRVWVRSFYVSNKFVCVSYLVVIVVSSFGKCLISMLNEFFYFFLIVV